MLVGHRDMIGYHKQAMPPDDSSKNISPTPSVDIQRSTGHGLNLQKQSSRMVMKADFTQPDRKYHELSTHELEECAHRRCLLHIDEMSRNCLMENLRILDGWHARTAPFYQSRSAASLPPSDISVARQPKLEVGFPRATAISQEQEAPHFCSCGKCYDYCQYYTKALDCWVPCCFSWFIGLHTCPHIIKAELTLEPKCRLQNDGKTVWLGLFVTAMKLKNDDWGDSVNGTYDLHQWDFHCTIGVFRLTKKATVHSRLTPVELWDQKMLQIGVSHRKCNCRIERVLDEEEVDWYKQWKICYGGDALTSARNTMMQCFPFNHHGPPVEVMRTFQAWRPGLFLHLSAYNKKRDNNSLTTSLCTPATDRFAAAVTDDC